MRLAESEVTKYFVDATHFGCGIQRYGCLPFTRRCGLKTWSGQHLSVTLLDIFALRHRD